MSWRRVTKRILSGWAGFFTVAMLLFLLAPPGGIYPAWYVPVVGWLSGAALPMLIARLIVIPSGEDPAVRDRIEQRYKLALILLGLTLVIAIAAQMASTRVRVTGSDGTTRDVPLQEYLSDD